MKKWQWYVVSYVNILNGEVSTREEYANSRSMATRQCYCIIGKQYRRVFSVRIKK